MQFPTLPKLGRHSKVHSFAVAGTATAALTVLAITAGVQGSDGTALAANEPAAVASVSTADPQTITDQADAAAAKKADADAAAKKKAAADAAAAKKKADAAAAAKKKKAADEAAQRKQEEQAANRSHERKALAAAKEKAATKAAAAAPAPAPAAVTYSNDLDGWIKESLSVMAAHNIPGTYDGIYRNIIRESSGNPQAINLTDSNAMAGIPSKGLLQVIDPTFQQYHVEGTSMDIYDPVANITAACNYAAANYGTIDNVDSAY